MRDTRRTDNAAVGKHLRTQHRTKSTFPKSVLDINSNYSTDSDHLYCTQYVVVCLAQCGDSNLTADALT